MFIEEVQDGKVKPVVVPNDSLNINSDRLEFERKKYQIFKQFLSFCITFKTLEIFQN